MSDLSIIMKRFKRIISKSKPILAISKNRLVLLLVLILFLTITGIMFRQQSLSFHFVDEEDNFVVGNYLLKGEKLYVDIFSHHQPLSYFFSAFIQKATGPNSIFLLVKRHREAIIGWSAIWSFFLVFRFGMPAFFTVVIYELSKIYLLGNLFLVESLVVYPLMYLVGLVLVKRRNNLRNYELFFAGICFSMLAFLLATLWPLLLVLLFTFFYISHEKRRGRFLFLGACLLTALVLLSIPIRDYFYDTVYINQKYYIPHAAGYAGGGFTVKSFFTPVLSLFLTGNVTATLVMIRCVSLLLLFNLFLLIIKKKYYHLLLIFFLLGLANIRYIAPGSQEYAGFHLLPWFGLLLFITSLTSFKLIRNREERFLKIITISLLLLVLAVSVKYGRERLFVKRDINKDCYVNYSQQFSFGEAVKIMKKPNEKMFVAPDEMLIYWQADIDHAARFTYYYSWMTTVPELKSGVDDMFFNNPPTFWYFKNYKNELGLADNLSNYHRMKKDGADTDLYILFKKKEDLTKEQRDRLSFYGFEPD